MNNPMKTNLWRENSGITSKGRVVLAGIALLVTGACSRHPDPSPVRVVAVARTERTTLSNTMTLQAEFEPYQDVLIHGKVSGYVSQINVDIGDRLKAGDLIATLEVPELSDQLAGAVASQARARAEHDIAHLNATRIQGVNISQPGLIAQQDLDDANSKDSATEAEVASAKAESDRYSALMAYTKITAPFSGVVTKRLVDTGSLIQAGTSSNSEPIIELEEDDLLRLRFPVPEAETPSIRVGESVQIAVDALHRKFSGRIARDAGAIDRSTRTMATEVDVPNPDGLLKVGMYASIVLPLEQATNVLAVPLQALSHGDSPSAMVVDANGTVQERSVSVGLRTADKAEIRSGLNEGDRVVISDRGGLHPGDIVTAKETEPLTLQ
jgi:RND family efflux transporter MFP subunit